MSPQALELVAKRFKILSEPIRLRILQILQEGERSVGDLTQMIETSQPNISKHLRILQDDGIVDRRHEGNLVFYSIADERIFALCEHVCNSIEERIKNQADIFGMR